MNPPEPVAAQERQRERPVTVPVHRPRAFPRLRRRTPAALAVLALAARSPDRARRKRRRRRGRRKPFASSAPTEPPVIDGELNEEIWVRAPLVDDFHQVTPVEFDEPERAHRGLRAVRPRRAVHRRAALRRGARAHQRTHPAARAEHQQRRPVLRPHRSVQQPPQRLPVRREPERRALRRRLRRRHATAVRLGRHLASGRAHHAGRLDARDRDPVQDTVVRPVADDVAHELRAQHPAQERRHGVELAQSQHRSVDDGRRDRHLADPARPRPRRRAVGERTTTGARSARSRPTPRRSLRSTCSTRSRRSSTPR